MLRSTSTRYAGDSVFDSSRTIESIHMMNVNYVLTATSCDAGLTVHHIEIRAEVPTPAQAELIAASFPKALRMKSSWCGQVDGSTTGVVSAIVDLLPSERRGVTNEAGLKRLRRLLPLLTWTLGERSNVTKSQVEALLS